MSEKNMNPGNETGKFLQGCITAIFVIVLIAFLIPLLAVVIYTVRLFGINIRSLIPIFVLFVFASSFVQIIRARLKRQRRARPIYKPEEGESRNIGKLEESKDIPEDMLDVYKAFSLLKASPEMTYTQVSQKYYELVKKVNQLKIDEEERNRKLKELEEAFEKVTKYYSERS
ncbi:hypothetical protein [Fervidobacterium thailandense]|uniref:Uncharacterized protein n=1 Tax=Fervidobacterium thailandense TaxID=1008305 RepID=A0A1E3G204_9BACT|nr:hypothetical protein [Fervidobacterium thailandense]ODN30297.1 hypothetical protein A4H02_06325 [Fervidobacterium thailandense]